MVHKILFWTGFGLAVRFWQLGIEMRPFFNRSSLWVYPLFGGVGAAFGYYLEGVSTRQRIILEERKERLLEKRKRRDEREKQQGVEGQIDGAVREDIAADGPRVIRGTSWGR